MPRKTYYNDSRTNIGPEVERKTKDTSKILGEEMWEVVKEEPPVMYFDDEMTKLSL